jgi:hypothetical protein
MTGKQQFVFKVGPIPSQQGPVFAFFVFPGEGDKITFFSSDDRSALIEIVAAYPGSIIQCEPQLSEAASGLGIEADFTAESANMLGMIVFDIALSGQLKEIERQGLIYEFGTACSKFWHAAPWKSASATKPLEIVLQGTIEGTAESLVLGASGVEYGLAIYPMPGSIDQVISHMSVGLLGEAIAVDTIGVVFKDEPLFAVDGMERAYGVKKLPVPIKVAGGERRQLKDLDLLLLTAALQAASSLTEQTEKGIGHVKVEGMESFASARIKDRDDGNAVSPD